MKETELEIQEVDNQDEEETKVPESAEDEETEESETKPDETEETDEEESEKPDKVQKRINQLTAVKKSLEEELAKVKEDAEEAQAKAKYLEDEITKSRQTYLSNQPEILTLNGKHMYELTEDEFDQVLDSCLNADTEAEQLRLTRLARVQRKAGKPLAKHAEEKAAIEDNLWLGDWGIVTRVLLEHDPELKKHIKRLSDHITKDKADPFTYRKLQEGGVKAKLTHVIRLMNKLGIETEIETEAYAKDRPAPGKTAGKGKANTHSNSKTPSFTRAQIDKMSQEEFLKNEDAIDAAMKGGRIK